MFSATCPLIYCQEQTCSLVWLSCPILEKCSVNAPCVIHYDSWKCVGDGGMKGITQTSKDLKKVDVDKQYQLWYPTLMGFPECACSVLLSCQQCW